MKKADKFRQVVLKQVGKKYIFGHEVRLNDPNPRAFDCSELVQWAFYQVGYKVVDGSFNQYAKCTKLSRPSRVGDLFFLKNSRGRIHHVGIYLGGDTVVEAKGRLWGVVRTTVSKANKRGAIWGRYKGVDLGDSVLSGKPTSPKPAKAKPKVKIPKYLVEGMPRNLGVSNAQTRLKNKGFYKGRIDGDFGPATRRAVIEFQKKVFPETPKQWDGIIGPITMKKLGMI